MAAFNHIAAAVDPIYKALTRAPEHPMGGSAYLSTENAEEVRLASYLSSRDALRSSSCADVACVRFCPLHSPSCTA